MREKIMRSGLVGQPPERQESILLEIEPSHYSQGEFLRRFLPLFIEEARKEAFEVREACRAACVQEIEAEIGDCLDIIDCLLEDLGCQLPTVSCVYGHDQRTKRSKLFDANSLVEGIRALEGLKLEDLKDRLVKLRELVLKGIKDDIRLSAARVERARKCKEEEKGSFKGVGASGFPCIWILLMPEKEGGLV